MKGGGDQPGQRRGEQGKRREALGEDLGPGKDGKERLVRMGLGKSGRVDAGGERGEGDKEHSQANGGSEDHRGTTRQARESIDQGSQLRQVNRSQEQRQSGAGYKGTGVGEETLAGNKGDSGSTERNQLSSRR